MPGDLLFARRAKRATRLVNRKIDRPAIDADVQERPDCRADQEGERAEEKLVNRMAHARSDINARLGIATPNTTSFLQRQRNAEDVLA